MKLITYYKRVANYLNNCLKKSSQDNIDKYFSDPKHTNIQRGQSIDSINVSNVISLNYEDDYSECYEDIMIAQKLFV